MNEAAPASGHLPLPKRAWPFAAAVTSGLLLAPCFEPWNLSGLVWIWPAPLFAALWFSPPPRGWRRWRWGFVLGYLAGLAFFLTSLTWFLRVGDVIGTVFAGIGAWIGICAYLALYPAAFGAFAATVGRWTPHDPTPSPDLEKAHFLSPSRQADLFGQSIDVLRIAMLNGAAWCGLEWLRGVALTGFPWNGLAVALLDHLMLLQFADVIGACGYGFVLVFCAVIAFATVIRLIREIQERKRLRPHFDFAAGVAVVIFLFLYGLGRMTTPPPDTIELRARILQLNVPLNEKWSEDDDVLRQIVYDYRDLTRTFVETGRHDLVIWPESALPGHFSYDWVQDFFNDQLLAGDDFWLLSGMEDFDFAKEEIYNTIVLMRGDTESYQMYKKRHLVPFGEFVPGRGGWFPVFEWLLGWFITDDFTPGDSLEPLVLEIEDTAIGIIPSICFENTLADYTRRFVRRGPQLIVNVTNDAWFFGSHEPAQHFAHARLRCIELRRPMARAANTGVSGFIDERGSTWDRHNENGFERVLRDVETGDTEIRGSLPATLHLATDPPITIYARIGDAFSIGMGLLALFATGLWGWKQSRDRTG